MKPPRAFAVVACALLVIMLAQAVFIAGCDEKAKEQVKELFEEQATHHKKTVRAQKVLADFFTKWNKLVSAEAKPENIAEAKVLLESAINGIDSAITQITEEKRILLEIEKLDASKELSKYCSMKTEAFDEWVKALEGELKAMQMRQKLLSDAEAGATVDQLLKDYKQAEQLELEAQQQVKKAGALDQDATDYYAEKKLDKWNSR